MISDNIKHLTDNLLLQQFSPASVLVTPKGDILYVTGNTGKYLSSAAGKASSNIFSLALQGLTNELPIAFRKAMRNYDKIVLERVKIGANDGTQLVNVTLQQIENPLALKGKLLLVFEDVLSELPAKSGINKEKNESLQMQTDFEQQLQRLNEELKRSKNKAELIAEKYSNIYDNVPCGYFTLNTECIILDLNLSGSKMLSKPHFELKDCNFNLFIMHDARKDFNDFLNKMHLTRKRDCCEVQLVINGEPATFVYVHGVYVEENQTYLINVIDFTKRKEAERKTKKALDLLKSTERVAHIGSSEWDMKENKLNMSDEFLQVHGFTNRNITIVELMSTVHPDDVKMVRESQKAALDGVRPYDIIHRIIRQDNGEERIIHGKGTVSFDENGKPYKAIGSAQDITEKVKSEAALKESETQLRIITDNLPVIISHLDKDLKYLFANKYYYDKGDFHTDITGKNAIDVLGEASFKHALPNMKRALAGESVNFESRTTHGNSDELRVFEINYIPNIVDGVVESFFVLGIDITKRKQAEEQLTKAKEKAEESDQLKTEFINNMSHEIRTPMNGILGFSSILSTPNLTDEKKKFYINIIQNSGNQLLHIIDDILEISKLGAKQVKTIETEVCLNNLLLEHFSVFDIKAKEHGTPLYLHKGLSDHESLLLIDATKLNKILSNLLTNALKFTSEGCIEFGYIQKDKELEIYVKDTGIGIKLEKQETIFKRFSQEEKSLTKNVGGLGLGLSIAKENAHLLGGKIIVKSEKGKGATFTITIPYKPVNSKIQNNTSQKVPEKDEKRPDTFTILIAEDEEVNYLYLEILLQDMERNVSLIHAKHGLEAVEICKKSKEIDLVLMDLKMPRMKGIEATQLIKEFRPELPIVAQTAYSTTNERQQAFLAGCDDFISKPIRAETLKGILKKYLKKKQQ